MQRETITNRLRRLEDELGGPPEPVPIFGKRLSGVVTNCKTGEEFATEAEALAAAGNPEFCVIMTEVDARRKPKEIEHAAN